MLWPTTALATTISAAFTRVAGYFEQPILEQQRVLHDVGAAEFKCHISPALDPAADGLPAARDIFSGEETLIKQVERLGTLVKIPSISYDDSGEPGEDPRWDVFYQMHDALEALYPIVHARMARNTVNIFGLVYTIKGRNPSLKPLMFTGHQDVTPADDPSAWKYPPFAAHFDGEWLWGRGASDDKNSITAIFSALETLLSHASWTPERTIIVALGFDEEDTGQRGAGIIAPYLETLYGSDSMIMLLDEGGLGLELLEGTTLYALPAVREKGRVDVWLDLHVKGGHSSMPFPHTGIGIMSEIVVRLESNPYIAKLFRDSPIHNHLVCQAKYSPNAAPKITKLINEGDLNALTEELVVMGRSTQYRIQTSRAVDYFTGGAKINALPERIRIGINHRVAPQDSIPGVKRKILDDIKPVVKKYNITVKAFEGEEMNPDMDIQDFGPAYEMDYSATLTLTTSQQTAMSPISSTSNPVWDVFSGTIQHSFAFLNGTVIPVGEMMLGNTDTRHYLNLTKNIYRWVPTRKGWSQNIHGVDEAIYMQAHMDAIRFYYDLIRNFDASDI